MAINLLNGQMLNSTLERDGINLAIVNTANSVPALYVDVGNTLIGINTSTPTQSLTVGGNAIADNLFSNNNVSVAGNILGGNLSVSGNVTTGNIKVNQTGVLNLANLSITNTTIDSISPGNLVAVAGANGLVLPAGNTLQRPSLPPIGTTRFNTTTNEIEAYDGVAWITGNNSTVGSVSDQQIVPDGVSTMYTLDQTATTDSIIVSINGVVQLPNIAYTVSGTTITFPFAPLITDTIDIRFITYFSTTSSLTNDSGNSYVLISNTPNIEFGVAGNVAVTIDAAGVFAIQGKSLQLPIYTTANAIAIANPTPGQVIFTTNGNSGVPSLAVYDGFGWKRVVLGTTISAT